MIGYLIGCLTIACAVHCVFEWIEERRLNKIQPGLTSVKSEPRL